MVTWGRGQPGRAVFWALSAGKSVGPIWFRPDRGFWWEVIFQSVRVFVRRRYLHEVKIKMWVAYLESSQYVCTGVLCKISYIWIFKANDFVLFSCGKKYFFICFFSSNYFLLRQGDIFWKFFLGFSFFRRFKKFRPLKLGIRFRSPSWKQWLRTLVLVSE